MRLLYDYQGRAIRLTAERQNHIYRSLAQTPEGPKHLCVVVKVLPGDAFVITAYLTDKVKKGRVLWPTAV